jgi:hypothetical protein
MLRTLHDYARSFQMKLFTIVLTTALFSFLPASIALAQAPAGTDTPAAPAPPAASPSPAPAATPSPAATAEPTAKDTGEKDTGGKKTAAKKKRSSGAAMTRQEIDHSVDTGTVPSRYRKQVPKEYQQYVPFEK